MPGAPQEARWHRPEPRRSVAPELLGRIFGEAFPQRRVLSAAPLAGGLRNANFKVALDGSPGTVVLRLYEHDASICRKEADILRRLAGVVPVPQLYQVKEGVSEELPPFALMQYVDGITFHELKNRRDREAIAQAARSAGETLAAIAGVSFDRAGWLGPGLAVGAPLLEGPDPLPRFLDLCLAQPIAERRIPAEWRHRVRDGVWQCAARLAELDTDPRLVHGDFNRRNLLVRPAGGHWRVTAVLDWEFAVAGSPLADVGSFLRYEKPDAPLVEPHFSEGYRAGGGSLPADWRALSCWLTLSGICESLTHEDLPDGIADELVELLIRHCR